MQRIAPKLTYANVVSTLALFGVLAGGVAIGFQGQGSIERVNVANPPEETERSLLKLPGIGELRIGCDEGSGSVELFLENESGKVLGLSLLRTFDAGNAEWGRTADVADGDRSDVFGISGPGAAFTTTWISIAPEGKSSRPQVTGVINADRGCDLEGRRTSAMLFTTEQ